MDSFSLAQGDADTHQECKWQRRFCFRVFQNRLPGVAENSPLFAGLICRLNADVGPDFHGFLWSSTSALWIWLETEAALVHLPFFSHRYQIPRQLLHSLCTMNRLYPSLLARYPK